MPAARGHVRLYQTLRSAHLERARVLAPADIVYASTRYDFDASLGEGLALHDAPGLRAVGVLARLRPEVVEVNEPLMLQSAIWTAATLRALDLVMRGRRPLVVTYAIENLDPFTRPTPRLRNRARLAAERRAALWLWRRTDRIAYGTAAARDLYHEALGSTDAEEELVWALPAPLDNPAEQRTGVVFASSFATRKGVPELLRAWPRVVAGAQERGLPRPTLTMIGSGQLLQQVQDAAAHDDSIVVMVSPPRAEVNEAVRGGAVMVLPSQQTATWKEQVGLPVVEGLAAGATIVTTTETGLAEWLRDHGHQVVSPGDDDALVDALLDALAAPVPPADVLASLPPEDGRLAADAWMFRERN